MFIEDKINCLVVFIFSKVELTFLKQISLSTTKRHWYIVKISKRSARSCNSFRSTGGAPFSGLTVKPRTAVKPKNLTTNLWTLVECLKKIGSAFRVCKTICKPRSTKIHILETNILFLDEANQSRSRMD